MKHVGLLGIMATFVLLAGCQDTQLINCQQENQALQTQLDQAKATATAKDKKIEDLEGEIQTVNQKALESIRTILEKQNAKDVELKNKLKIKEAEAAELQQKLDAMQAPVVDADTGEGGM
ncbi:MAG: hypothetical protein H8E62_02250 [Planctomycetes bacterium]|nr:hypothetical protein [Planctomycetota bacterium]